MFNVLLIAVLCRNYKFYNIIVLITIVCAQWKRLDETVRLGTYNVNEREVRKYLVFNNKKCLYLINLK